MERISCNHRLAAILAVLLIAAQVPAAASAVPANAATAAAQAADAGVLSSLPFSDKQFIGLDQPAPATVNPRLWRNAQLKLQYGLFKVTERIYQVRGYDLSNITFIQGDRAGS